MLSGRIEDFKDLSQFSSIKDFNNNIELFLALHKKDLTLSEILTFKRLIRFSVKVAGVANISINKLIESIKEKDCITGVSRSTVKRLRKKLEQLGILEIKPTERKNGSQSSNVWIFKRFDKNRIVDDSKTIEPPKTEREQPKSSPQKGKVFKQLNPLKTSILSKTNNQYINKRKIQRLDSTFTASYVPKEFVQVVKPFFDDAATIEDFWKSVYLDTRKITNIVDSETITYTAIDAFKQSIRGYKRGKIKTSLVRYFTGTFKKRMDQVYFDLPLSI